MSPTAVSKNKEYIIDAGVVIKWFSKDREKYWEESRKLIRQVKEKKIVVYAPEFLVIEVINICFNKKHFSVEEITKVIQFLLGSGIEFVKISTDSFIAIVKIMCGYKTSAYDALYLLLAKEKKCKLLTFDNELLKKKDLAISIAEGTSSPKGTSY